jgi:hypothetical protein
MPSAFVEAALAASKKSGGKASTQRTGEQASDQIIRRLQITNYLDAKAGDKVACPSCDQPDDDQLCLHVYGDEKGWYCFGCQRGGSVIDYVMLRDGLTNREAVIKLADQLGIKLPSDPELVQVAPNLYAPGKATATRAATPAQTTPAEPDDQEDATGEAAPEEPSPFLDWSTFWDTERHDEDWLYRDVLARGRGHALYASHKAGKSLLMLAMAAELATRTHDTVVVYLDYEMTEDDLAERLQDMGYGPHSDLSRLCYALLPSLPPLDSRDGALALERLLDAVQAEHPGRHLLVAIDTTSRAVVGEENASDTFRAFYSHTGIALKRRGATWARLDHAGKDTTRGQRGSSAKGDDVDVVWRLVRTDNGISLKRDVARMSWVPELVTFAIDTGPLTFRRIEGDWPEGTEATARLLDQLGVPIDASGRQAQQALRDSDQGRRSEIVRAAQRWRQKRGPTLVPLDLEGRDAPPDAPPDETAGRTPGRTPSKPQETGPDA